MLSIARLPVKRRLIQQAVMGSLKPRNNSLPLEPSGPAVSLGSTIGSFASRMKRKLREQEDRDEESQRDAESRHARMLQALNIIRRALQETGQIQLGSRFELQFDVGDWEGWPRLSLNLIDLMLPNKVDYALVVSAHDRKALGSVELRMKSGQLLGQVMLRNEGELERIPLVLKRAVRAFLDVVAEYVLNPADPAEFKGIESELLDSEEVLDEQVDKLSKQDVFSNDDYSPHDNIVNRAEESDPLELEGAAETAKA